MSCGASILEGGQNPGGHLLSRTSHRSMMGCLLRGSNPWAPPTASSTPPGMRSRSVRAGRAPTAAARGSSEPTAAPPGGAAVCLRGAEGRQAVRSPRQRPISSVPLPLLGHVAPTPRLCPTTRPPRRHVLGLTSQQGAAGQGQQQAQRRAHPVPICSTWPRWVPRRARAPGPPATTMGSQKPGCRKSNPTALFVPEAAALRPPHGKQRRLRAQRVRCTEVGTNPHRAALTKGHPAARGDVLRPPGGARPVLGAAGQCHPAQVRPRKRWRCTSVPPCCDSLVKRGAPTTPKPRTPSSRAAPEPDGTASP